MDDKSPHGVLLGGLQVEAEAFLFGFCFALICLERAAC